MNPRDLDNWITGHYGEDYFREDDSDMDYKTVTLENLTFSFDANISREEANILLEFLNNLFNEQMHISTIVSYTVNKEDKNNEQENPRTMS